EMDRSGAGGREADADRVRAGELRVAARHERRHLLVARLDELGAALLLGPVEGTEERVDAVARIAVHPLHAPFAQPLEHVVGDELGHPDHLQWIGLRYDLYLRRSCPKRRRRNL